MKRAVKRRKSRKTARPTSFAYALRSFLGYLEGTSKAAHTISSYKSDVLSFRRFLEAGLGSSPVDINALRISDLKKYDGHLRTLGLKTNSRRRKILTAGRMLRYLASRNKLSEEFAGTIAAPEKVERVPLTFDCGEMTGRIAELPAETNLDARNRILLWVLAETGCRVSEAARLRFENWNDGSPAISFSGKFERDVPVSAALSDAARDLRKRTKDEKSWMFLGHNKFGPLKQPITPRGIELLVKAYADRFGCPEMTPRTFRHSVVVQWAKSGIPMQEIQRRLGLRTQYSLRIYIQLLNHIQRVNEPAGMRIAESIGKK